MELVRYLRTHWDRVGGWCGIAVGALVITVGWVGVSGTAYVFEQLPYIISGGVGGLFLLGLGATLLLSADLRDEWRKLDAIEHHLSVQSQAGAHPAAEEASDTPRDEPQQVVNGAVGTTRSQPRSRPRSRQAVAKT